MGLIRVIDVAGGADTTEQGQALWNVLGPAMRNGDAIVVSFAGLNAATTSFVNVSFVQLLDYYSFDEIKRRVRVIDASKQIAEMIRTRVSREAMAA